MTLIDNLLTDFNKVQWIINSNFLIIESALVYTSYLYKNVSHSDINLSMRPIFENCTYPSIYFYDFQKKENGWKIYNGWIFLQK